MVEKNDWRIRNQIDYLYETELVKTKYYLQSMHWDHEHCEFCWVKFDSDDIVGYSTRDGYYWICEECFKDFCDIFKWEVVIG